MLPLRLKKTTDVGPVSEVSLNEGLDSQYMKLSLGLPWKTQEGLHARAMGYLQREAANTERKEPKGKSMLESTKLKRIEDLEYLDIRHGHAEFGVCPVGFCSFFGPVFLHCIPFPMP